MKKHLALNLGIAATTALAMVLGSVGAAVLVLGTAELYASRMVHWFLR